MIKSTATALGLLFLISSIYYLSFWWNFDIDIFQYLQTSDMIKGIVYPLRDAYSLLFTAIGEILIALLYIIRSDVKKSNYNRISIIKRQKNAIKALKVMTTVASFFAITVGVAHYNIIFSKAYSRYAVSSGNIALPAITLAFVLAYFLWYNTDMLYKLENPFGKKEDEKSKLMIAIDCSVLILAIYFFFAALSYGVINSRKIINRISYDYVQDGIFLEKEGVCFSDTLFYLGAAGDRYFFLKPNSAGYFIIDKYKVPILTLAHCSVKDENKDISDEITKYIRKSFALQVFLMFIAFLLVLPKLIRFTSYLWIKSPYFFRFLRRKFTKYQRFLITFDMKKWFVKNFIYSRY